MADQKGNKPRTLSRNRESPLGGMSGGGGKTFVSKDINLLPRLGENTNSSGAIQFSKPGHFPSSVEFPLALKSGTSFCNLRRRDCLCQAPAPSLDVVLKNTRFQFFFKKKFTVNSARVLPVAAIWCVFFQWCGKGTKTQVSSSAFGALTARPQHGRGVGFGVWRADDKCQFGEYSGSN